MSLQCEIEITQKIRNSLLRSERCSEQDIKTANAILAKLCTYKPAVDRIEQCAKNHDGVRSLLDLPIGWYDGSADKAYRAKIAEEKRTSRFLDKSAKVSIVLFREAFIRAYRDDSAWDSLAPLCDLDRLERYAESNCARSLIGNEFTFFHSTWTVTPAIDWAGRGVCILHPCNDIVILAFLFALFASDYVNALYSEYRNWFGLRNIGNFKKELKLIIAEQLFEWQLTDGLILPPCRSSLRRPWIYDWQLEFERLTGEGVQYPTLSPDLLASLYSKSYIPAIRIVRNSRGKQCLLKYKLILEDARQIANSIFSEYSKGSINVPTKPFRKASYDEKLWNEARKTILRVGTISSGKQDLQNEVNVMLFLNKYQLRLHLRSSIPFPVDFKNPELELPVYRREDWKPKSITDLALLAHDIQRSLARAAAFSEKEFIRYIGVLVPIGDLAEIWKKVGLVHTSLTAFSHTKRTRERSSLFTPPEHSDADTPTVDFKDIINFQRKHRPQSWKSPDSPATSARLPDTDIPTRIQGRNIIYGNKHPVALKIAQEHGHSYLPKHLQTERFNVYWNSDITKGVVLFSNYIRNFNEGIKYPNLRKSGLGDFEHIIAAKRDAIGFGLFARSIVESVIVAAQAGLMRKISTEVISHAIKVGLWEVVAEQGGEMTGFRRRWDQENLDEFVYDIQNANTTDILRLNNLVRIAELFVLAMEGWL